MVVVWKKALVIALLLCLALSQVAFAAEDEKSVITPQHGIRYQAKLLFERVRLGFTLNPVRKAMLLANQAGERLRELEALQETDPEAVKEKLLAAHDQAVARAEQILANRDNLPEDIITKLTENQAKALELATQAAAEAKDPEIAEKRLNLLKARQELTMAAVTKNAEQIAQRTLERAEQVIASADQVRERIQAGEGLEMLRARLQRWKEQAQQRREQFLRNRRGK